MTLLEETIVDPYSSRRRDLRFRLKRVIVEQGVSNFRALTQLIDLCFYASGVRHPDLKKCVKVLTATGDTAGNLFTAFDAGGESWLHAAMLRELHDRFARIVANALSIGCAGKARYRL